MSSELNARVTKRTDLAPGLMCLHVAPHEWALPDYMPGQFTVLGLPETHPRHPDSLPEKKEPPKTPVDPTKPAKVKIIRKAYSLASTPHQKDELEFYITMVKEGELTPRLFTLQMGDPVYLGPKITGHFTLESVPADAHVVLVSTGTGLAPYVSMIRTEITKYPKRMWSILHGVRHSWELSYRDELSAYARLFNNFAYFPIISRPNLEKVPYKGMSGYVQDVWKKGLVADSWGFKPSPKDTHFFFCGNPAMITEFITTLKTEGYEEHSNKVPGQLHSEKYW
jgi:ferredoxin--NADP+ reductase